MKSRFFTGAAVVAVAALALTGCTASADESDSAGGALKIDVPDLPTHEKIGDFEDSLDIVAWSGFVEPAWSDDFTKETGCTVNRRVAGTSDEMVQLMRTGDYDLVSASGDASLRLIAGGDVAPLNA
jgi:putative spermidine/putrescine transport system substrate-binding protein